MYVLKIENRFNTTAFVHDVRKSVKYQHRSLQLFASDRKEAMRFTSKQADTIIKQFKDREFKLIKQRS